MAGRGLAYSIVAASMLVAASPAPAAPAKLDPARIEALKTFVRHSMDELGIPGAAIAVVDHGRILFEGGFGVRRLGDPAPVDAHTLFMIASNTKPLTTLLLARLVDQGKLAWSEPVVQAYPGFRLGDEATTDRVEVRHLVCACTGMPRRDYEWGLNSRPDTPAANTFALLATMQPTTPFGKAYQYNNLMAAAAGYVAGHALFPEKELGDAYDAAMQRELFAPLGMHETTFDFARALRGDHADPHGFDADGNPAPAALAPDYMEVPYRPQGGAWSSAHDLIRYVRLELAEGRLPGGRRLVSAENLLARRRPGVTIDDHSFYGIGLIGDTGWGVPVFHHAGADPGYKSDFVFIPDADVGAVILTNGDGGDALGRPFIAKLVELLYGGTPQAEARVTASARRIRTEAATLRKTLTIPADRDLASALAGTYANPELGTITVSQDGDGTSFRFASWGSKVGSRRNDDGTASFVTIDPTTAGIEFVASRRNGAHTLLLHDGPTDHLYVETNPVTPLR